MTRGGWLVWGLVVLLQAMPAQAMVYVVDSEADAPDADLNDTNCADAQGRCTLRAAVMQSRTLGHITREIQLPPGDFPLTLAGADEDLAASGDLDIIHGVILQGAGAGLTRIDGAGLDRVLDVHASGRLTIRDLTVTNGHVQDGSAGAGIRVASGGQLRIEDSVLSGHRSRATVGGIAIDTQGCVHMQRVRVLDNRDLDDAVSMTAAAPIRVQAGTVPGGNACLELEDSEVSGNHAALAGAISADGVAITLRRSLLSGNGADMAGAMDLSGLASARLESVTVSGNQGDVGAIRVGDGARLDVLNGTITLNSPRAGSTMQVGGIHDLNTGAAAVFLSNTILAGNGPGMLADDCLRAVSVGGGNLLGTTVGCQFAALPGDQLDVPAPLAPLADLGGFTRGHLPGGRAIDRGWNGGCTARDQRDLPRPVDHAGGTVATCDIGAIELRHAVPTFVVDTTLDTVDAQIGDGVCADDGQHCSLRAAIQESNAMPGVQRIDLPAGVFALSREGRFENAAATGDLDITDDLWLRGAGDALSVIDGGALDRVIEVLDGSHTPHVTIERLTLRNGLLQRPPGGQGWHDGGGAVQVAEGAFVQLQDVTLRGNRVTDKWTAGSALVVYGRLVGHRVRILDNSDDAGRSPAQVGLRDDGPCQARAHLELDECQISGNTGMTAGAAIALCGELVLKRCLVSDNHSNYIGAIQLNFDGPTRLENVTLTGNRASIGAIQNDGFSRLDIFNSTLTGNGPGPGGPGTGGGIVDVHGGAGMTWLANSILAGNGPAGPGGSSDCNRGRSMGGNIIGDSATCAQFAALPSDQLGVMPALQPLSDHGGFTQVVSPADGSAAIDLGVEALCLQQDQRGMTRPLDGDGDGVARCDVGAVELQRDSLFVDGFEAVAAY